jgi:transposase
LLDPAGRNASSVAEAASTFAWCGWHARDRSPATGLKVIIRQKCTEALQILDRFHIVAKMNKALDEVCGEETARMKREGRDPVLKKSRWLLLRRSENLGAEQHFRLRDLLRYNLKTVRAYLLKEAFQQLWEYNSPVDGLARRCGFRRSK